MTNDPCPVTQQRLVESEARQALAIKQRDELARLINEHNAELVVECNRNRWDENKCLPYARIAEHKQCSDCKKDYLIEIPEWAK